MNTSQNLNQERIALLVLTCIYLVVFNPELPHGDALRIVEQINSRSLDWNPNHLLLDPIGYYWYLSLQIVNNSITPLGSFELISAISTLISVYLFHLILVNQKIDDFKTRILAVILLFGAKNFLTLSVSQYYFMVQMPFLLGALYCLLKYFNNENKLKNSSYLIISSACLSIATAIEANNILLIVITGLVLSVKYKNEHSKISDALIFYSTSALVGFPLFFLGYTLSGSDVSFLSWGLTYAGSNSEEYKQLYGLQASLSGVVLSFAKLGFNFIFSNFVETSGLGIGLKSLASSHPLEFNPDYFGIGLALLAMPIIAVIQLLIFIDFYRQYHSQRIFIFFLGWIISYLIFAFLWDNGGNIFWFQTLPVIVVIYAYYTQYIFNHRVFVKPFIKNGLLISPLIIITLNTIQGAAPSAFFDMKRGVAEHNEIVHDGDLEITTGWDKYQWMKEDAIEANFDKLLLMNMATKQKSDPKHISNLPQIVENHLAAGKRVIAARLYNKDSDPNPWYNLSRMGWPRAKIKKMLENYCNREISRIDDVVFHEIYLCDKNIGDAD
ncbi:MAG: hypothetical protein P8163_05965 [Candidatus Thiodiazotropha sp.]